MSFANEVKEELASVLPNARHCQLAELAALNAFSSKPPDENSPVGRKCFTLRKKDLESLNLHIIIFWVDPDFDPYHIGKFIHVFLF